MLRLLIVMAVGTGGTLAAESPAWAAPATVTVEAACPPPTPTRASCLAELLLPSNLSAQEQNTPAFRSLKAAHRIFTRTTVADALAGHGPNGGYSPSDLTSAYGLPPSPAGTGQTVAIVAAYGEPNAESDLAIYRARFKLPPCTTANGCFHTFDQNGGTNYPAPESAGSNADWSLETSIDVDMVSAICPACHIDLVEATADDPADFTAAETEATKLGVNAISNSWGFQETQSQTTLDSAFVDPGVPIVFASGDGGYGALWPASSPKVISVGGTTLTADGSSRGWTDTVWSDSGGGCSTYEPIQAWQNASLGCTKRLDNDVSAVADAATGPAVYDSVGFTTPGLGGGNPAGWAVVGGTSVAAPIIAATYALSTPSARSAGASGLYAGLYNFFDVKTGSNGSCPFSYECDARVGYDGPSGWGTPDGPFGGTPSLPASASRASTVTFNGTPYVLFRGSGGTVWAASFSGGIWTPQALPGEWAVSDPTAGVVGSMLQVYYVGGDGDIHKDVLSNGSWSSSDTGVSGASGDPSYVYLGVPGVVYRGANGDIWWDVASVNQIDTGAQCGQSIPARGDPSATVAAGVLTINFAGTDGNIHTATYNNSTQTWTCSVANATGASGDVGYVPHGFGFPTVVYRGPNADIWLDFVGAGVQSDVNTDDAGACTVAAAGDPVTTGTSNGANIYYVGTDGNLYEDVYTFGGWSCTSTGLAAYGASDPAVTTIAGTPTLLYFASSDDLFQGKNSGSSWSGADMQASVTGLSPASGTYAGGQSVTITGTGFTGASTVYFGNTAVPKGQFQVTSPTTISVPSIPAGIGQLDVTVATPWGATAANSADFYTYQPVITSVSPASGPVAGGNDVTLTVAGVNPGDPYTNPAGQIPLEVKFGNTVLDDKNSPFPNLFTVTGGVVTLTLTAPPGSAGTVPISLEVGPLLITPGYRYWWALSTPTDTYTYSG